MRTTILAALTVLSLLSSACAGPPEAQLPSSSTAVTSGGDTSGASATPDTVPPLPAICEPSVKPYPTTGAQVVGDGSPGSCTETALRTFAERGGTITFNCGADPIAIPITQTIQLPIGADTIIDGGGLVTLDAGQRVRHFSYRGDNWMVNRTKVVLQRLTLINGKAQLGEYFAPIDGYPECAYGYKQEAGGGAVLIRDGVLHVIDSNFYDNEAALIGPDVGGGAIYAMGASSVVVSGSRFIGNRASNGGAIGMLFANPEIYNSHFEDNAAVGTGQNRAVSEAECPKKYAFGHPNQAGAGGLAGAVFFDGRNDEDHTYVVCGSVFRNNRGNALAGALFRTPNGSQRRMRITDSVFDANTANAGGVSFLMETELVVERSLFTNNRAGKLADGSTIGDGYAHGLWVHLGSVDITNSTFTDKELTISGTATLRNVTLFGTWLSDDITLESSLLVNVGCHSTRPGSHNVQWPRATPCASGARFADPRLASPADNGGPTWTMMPGDAAAVAGVGSSCPPEDQRRRPRDPKRCAAGAVEP